MNGTFATQTSLTTSWSGIAFFENATNVPSTSWAIRTQTYDSSGNLSITTTQCGGTTIDLCGEGDPIGDEAYTQFFPTPDFDLTSMPTTKLSISIPNALPGQAYVEPQTAVLYGISLTDPLGAWPASNGNIGPGANQTNGAVWVDSDSDTFEGITSYAVPPGGIASTTAPYPYQSYGADSTACPRRDAGLSRLPYDYLPGIAGLTLVRIKRFYTGQRLVSSMSGSITSCDATGATLIQGTVGGPDSGNPQGALRVGGCVQVAGSGEAACSTPVVNTYDSQNQVQHITSASFIMKRVASGTTCTQVRALTFP
jgi:hypothetical protein